jgi:hypothetical protein
MILGLCGVAGAGKDTVADFLVAKRGCVKVALADPLKRICREVFNFSDDQLWGPSESRNALDLRYRRFPDNEYVSREIDAQVLGFDSGPKFLTPRFALQQLGTEWGRRCYDNVWVEYALRVANALLSNDAIIRPTYSAKDGADYTSADSAGRKPGNGGNVRGVVISDVRFKNEVDAIKAVGGYVWRVLRPGAGLGGTAGAHVSETEQLSMPDNMFNCLIDNSGTLKDLEGTACASFKIQQAIFLKQEATT